MTSRKKRSTRKAAASKQVKLTKRASGVNSERWHVNRANVVGSCGAEERSCPFLHYTSKAEAEAQARVLAVLTPNDEKPVTPISNSLLSDVETLLPRTPPQIYTFVVDAVTNAVGGFCPKLGDTTRSVEQRMSEWRRTDPIYRELRTLATIPAMFVNQLPDGTTENIYVRDYNFHKWLSTKGWRRLVEVSHEYPQLDDMKVSNEFFVKAGQEDMDDEQGKAFMAEMLEASLIDQKTDFENGGSTYQFYRSSQIRQRTTTEYMPTNSFAPREVQKELISKATNYFAMNKNSDSTSEDSSDSRFMIIAPTRSGKTYSALNVVKNVFEEKGEPSVALVVSGIVDTREEWKAGVQSHTYFAKERGTAENNICGVSPCECSNKFRFIDADELTLNPDAVKDAKAAGLNALVYLSLQDLSGSTSSDGKVKAKHKWLLEDGAVDLLVGDESHFAMFKPGGRYAESVSTSEEVYGGDVQSAAAELASTKPTIGQLFLTATPYGHVEWGGTFSPERNVARITEKQIREEREKWDADNAARENPLPEHHNPIYGLPQTTMFGVDLGMSPTDLFATDRHGNFLHKDNVRTFVDEFFGLRSVRGTNTASLNFLNSKEFHESGNGNHIYFHLPTKAAVDAMEKELTRVAKRAKYTILNISPRDGRNWGAESSGAIVNEISRAARNGERTITLTVNRLGTGVTVPEWDTVVIGSSMASAQRFQQVAGRAGTPWVTKNSVINDNPTDCLKCFVKPVREPGKRLCEDCFNAGSVDDDFKAEQFAQIEKPNAIVICLDPHTLINVQAEKIDTYLEFEKAKLSNALDARNTEAQVDDEKEDIENDVELSEETIAAVREEVLAEEPTYLVGDSHLLRHRDLEMQKLTPTNFIDKLMESVEKQGVAAIAENLPVKIQAMDAEIYEGLTKYDPSYGTSRYLNDKLAEESDPQGARDRRCQKPKCINPSVRELNRLGNSFRLCDTHYDEMLAEREAAKNAEEYIPESTGEPVSEEQYALTQMEAEILAAQQQEKNEMQMKLQDVFNRTRTMYTRVLMLSFVMTEEVNSVSDLLDAIDSDSRHKNTAVDFDIDIDLLRTMHARNALPARLSDVVGVLNRSSRSETVTPEKRLSVVLSSFNRFSQNEIPTPSSAVVRMFDKLDMQTDGEVGFYDSSSRVGEFLIEAEKRMKADGVTDAGEKLWATPSSDVAYQFTRWLYERKGWNTDHIIYSPKLDAKETSELLAAIYEERECLAQGGPGQCRIHSPESEAKLAETLSLYRDTLGNDYTTMTNNIPEKKFDYIIGNPPYQDRKIQIYPTFFLAAQKMADKVVMVFPEGWQKPGEKQGLKAMNVDEVKKDKRIVSIHNYGNELFDVGVDTGVVVWDVNHDNGLDGKQRIFEGDAAEPKIKRLAQDQNQRSLEESPANLVKLLKVIGEHQKDAAGWDSWTDEVDDSEYTIPTENLGSEISARSSLRLTSDIVKRTLTKDSFDDPKKPRSDSVIKDFSTPVLKRERGKDDDYIILATHKNSRVIGYADRSTLDALYAENSSEKVKTFVKEKISKYRVAHPHGWGIHSANGGRWAPIVIVKPGELTTHSFSWFEANSKKEAEYMAKYLLTQHARSLLFLRKRDHSTGPLAYSLVPKETFTEDWWSEDIETIDKKLAEKYGYDRSEFKETLDHYAPPLTNDHIKSVSDYTIYPEA